VDADRRLKRIARAGKEWKRTMGRKVDMEGRCCFLLFFLFCEGMLIFFFLVSVCVSSMYRVGAVVGG